MKEKKETEWEKIRTEAGPDLTLFTARFDWMRNPRNNHTVKATVLETPDWANIVALTPDNKIVVVHQYRFGTQRITTELPAGIVEPGETSQETATRELKEETGYETDDWEYLGFVEPNPAFMNNCCHHWLARNATKQSDQELDEGEDLAVSEMTLEEIQIEIREDRFRNALCVTALSQYFNLSGVLK